MATKTKQINAGYVIDLSFVATNVAEAQELLKTMSQFRCVGCKITSHQDYKIAAQVKAANVALSVFGAVVKQRSASLVYDFVSKTDEEYNAAVPQFELKFDDSEDESEEESVIQSQSEEDDSDIDEGGDINDK